MIDNDLAAMPARRREVELLIAGDDPDGAQAGAVELCAKAFGTAPVPGVLTYVSRGTDDDAHGVLAGLRPDRRDRPASPGDDGWDVVHVTLRKADLDRVPESRVHTALEASLNCEVHIRTIVSGVITCPGSPGSAGAACTHVSNRLKRLTLPLARTSRPRAPRRPPATAGR